MSPPPRPSSPAGWRYPCTKCPLRSLERFRKFEPSELEFVLSFKTGELAVDAGTTIIAEGSQAAHLYTVLSGWGFRYKLLDDGRRQILNFLLPGDLVGVQGPLMGKMEHSVEALTGMVLCVFERARLWDLYQQQPSLAFDVTWLAAREEQVLDEHLLSVGQRMAEERAAYLLLFLFSRAEARGMTHGKRISFPFTQPHIADALGLSLVHTNRVLNRLARQKLISLSKRELEIVNRDKLAKLAHWEPVPERPRPFI